MRLSLEKLFLRFICGSKRSLAAKGRRKAALYVSVAHTAHSNVNSGIQRVTRSIAKEVLKRFEDSDLLEWFIEQNRFILLDEVAREKFSHFSGPPYERIDELLEKEREALFSPLSKGGELDWDRLHEAFSPGGNEKAFPSRASAVGRLKRWCIFKRLKSCWLRIRALNRKEEGLQAAYAENILERMTAIRSTIETLLEASGEGEDGLGVDTIFPKREIEFRSRAEEAMLKPIQADPSVAGAFARIQTEELSGYFERLVGKLDRSGFRALNWVSFLPIPKVARRELRRLIRKMDNTRQQSADRKRIRSFIAKVVGVRRVIDRFRAEYNKLVQLKVVWESNIVFYLLESQRIQEGSMGSISTEDIHKSLSRVERLVRRLYPRRFLPPEDSWILIPELMTSEELGGVFAFARKHRLKVAIVFHDALPIQFPELVNERYRADHARYMEAIAQADCLLPVSEYSKRCYIEWAKESGVEIPRIEVCLNGVEFREKEERASGLGLPEGVLGDFALCVSTLEPRKNHLKLLEAWRRLIARGEALPQLVLVGNAYTGFEDLVDEIRRICSEEKGIVWLSGVDDEDLEMLYSGCRFSVFPSIAEGFGLPVLESIWYGRPCLCANFGAMEEAALGGGCLRIDMRDVGAIESGILSMAFDTALLSSLEAECGQRRLRTWSDYAAQVGQLLGFEDRS